MRPRTEQRLEILVDFIDDALLADQVLTVRDIETMMRTLAETGVDRVTWAYYGDGHGGLLLPENLCDGATDWGLAKATYNKLGNPLRVAVEAGHRHGLEVYAYFKPYETGVSMIIPTGSPEAGQFGLLPHLGGQLAVLDPFVRDHPHLRIQRRTDDLPTVQFATPICGLRLTKRDDTPTRLSAQHLQIWTSKDNYRYVQAPVSFKHTETVQPAAQTVNDHTGAVVTVQGDPVRIITLSGFRIDAPYVLVTTDLQEGPGDFSNSATKLLTALDADHQEIPGVIATGAGVWLAGKVDFRKWGLIFDYGWGKAVSTLDVSNADGRSGIIAFTRGKNITLPAALCETEPEVREFWLNCLQEMIEAGVDGIDFREENHCTHTDEPEAYGFNRVVLDRCIPSEDLRDQVAIVRGDAYTDFLRQAHHFTSTHGVKLRYHLNMDHFRVDPPECRALAYPANIRFNWQEWLSEGLLDEVVLHSYHYRDEMLTDPVGSAMMAACAANGIPISFNHHVFDDDPRYLEEATKVYNDGRFASLILYESSNFLRIDPTGTWRFTLAVAKDICKKWMS